MLSRCWELGHEEEEIFLQPRPMSRPCENRIVDLVEWHPLLLSRRALPSSCGVRRENYSFSF